MVVLPFHYCFGTSLLHTHLRVGGSLVLERHFLFPNKILQRIQETQCTGFAGVPSHYQILLRQSALKRTSLPSLRYCQQAGGALAPVFIRELVESLPGVEIYVMYGQTEATARLAYLPPHLLTSKIGSIGKPIPGVEIEIRDENDVSCSPGEIGEIVARGDNITAGYWNEPAETAATFRDGWLHTGDLARVDEEGFIYIVGRAKDFLKCGGNRVSSREIEQLLLEFPAVREVAVIGEPDEILGEAVRAFVVPTDGCRAALDEELAQFCKRRLPPHLRPKQIAVVESLPKNSAGKVLKPALRTAAKIAAAAETSTL
jgi:acyl-CoA synthetase (AMP-forming)/AMP-acid ligase II